MYETNIINNIIDISNNINTNNINTNNINTNNINTNNINTNNINTNNINTNNNINTDNNFFIKYEFTDNNFLNYFLKILIIKFNNWYDYSTFNQSFKNKHLSYISKIDSIIYKYKYYEYLLDLDNKLLISIFENSQILYFTLIKSIKKYSYRKFYIFNNEDLNLEFLSNQNTNFQIYIDKFIYIFTYNDFIKLINSSLLNYEDTNSEDDYNNVFLKTKKIKNPYTNIEFKKYVLYNFYIYCKKYNYEIPTIYKLFYESNFNIAIFCNLNEIYLTNNALKCYVKNLSNNRKYFLLIELINMFTIFISKHIKNNNIKYIVSSYKLKYYRLSEEEVSYYDYYIRLYLLQIYYFKNNMIKKYVNLKLKIVLYLLFDKNIKFISDNFNTYFLTNITIEYISELINNNLSTIMNYEIELFNQLNGNTSIYFISNNGLELSNNTETNNNENNNNETNNNETNNNETNNNETNNNETSRIDQEIDTTNINIRSNNENQTSNNTIQELEDVTNNIYLDDANFIRLRNPIKSKTIQNIKKIYTFLYKQINTIKNVKNIDNLEKFFRLYYINLKIIKRCLLIITIINIHISINVYILLKINNYIKLIN
jgi:hypothetical protein